MNKNTTYYSVALDESTDATDSAQVLYFVRAVTEEFEVYEELFALGTLKGRTRGIDVFNDFKENLLKKSEFCEYSERVHRWCPIYDW